MYKLNEPDQITTARDRLEDALNRLDQILKNDTALQLAMLKKQVDKQQSELTEVFSKEESWLVSKSIMQSPEE